MSKEFHKKYTVDKKETEKMGLILPEHYDPRLSVRETQEAIKYIRDTFQKGIRKRDEIWRESLHRYS